MTILTNLEEVSLMEEGEGTVHKVIADLLSYTKSLVVDSEPAYNTVTSLYRQARDWKKVIESRRKELIEPLRRETSRINDKAKVITDPLDQVIDVANSKTNKYMLLLEQAKKIEEEKLKIAAALFEAEEDVYVAPLENVVRGDGAMMVKKSEKRFLLVDISKVPTKYLMVNEEAVKRDLKLGIETIPGLEVYEETTTQLRVR